jgi:hypothetical protein
MQRRRILSLHSMSKEDSALTHLALRLLLWCLQVLARPDVAAAAVRLRDVGGAREDAPGRHFGLVPVATTKQDTMSVEGTESSS